MEITHEDSRYPTRNTKLAAALLVCGFQLRQADPFTVTRETVKGARQDTVLTFWFRPSHPGKAPMFARDFCIAWEARSLPFLNDMRYVLEKREWIIKDVIPGHEKALSETEIPAQAIVTDDIKLATVLAGHDIFLHGFRDRKFYFHIGEIAPTQAIVDEYNLGEDERQASGLMEKKVSWMKKVVFQYTELTNLVKAAMSKATALLFHNEKHNDTALVPLNANPQTKRAVLHELFKMDSRPGK